MEINSP
jgi:hypothetical protein